MVSDVAQDPVLVEATRGDMVESRHRGKYAVVDTAGEVVLAGGDIDQAVYARSAIKPLQALPLIETGAADHFGLGDKEIALACGSHHGEPMHVSAVTAWLNRIGLGADDLECGAHRPSDIAAADALVRAGASPSPLHNNCSGKHAGFLTTARFLGEPTRGYIDFEHPVQQRVLAVLESLTGLDLSRAPRGIDGCGIPVVGIPLKAIAHAMARLAEPACLPGPRAEAVTRVLNAMVTEPLMVSGTGSFTTKLLTVAGEAVRLKPGAEGVFCAALPRHGLGIALKVADGGRRASEAAMGSILVRLGVFSDAEIAELAPFLRPHITNVAGRVVGELRTVG